MDTRVQNGKAIQNDVSKIVIAEQVVLIAIGVDDFTQRVNIRLRRSQHQLPGVIAGEIGCHHGGKRRKFGGQCGIDHRHVHCVSQSCRRDWPVA